MSETQKEKNKERNKETKRKENTIVLCFSPIYCQQPHSPSPLRSVHAEIASRHKARNPVLVLLTNYDGWGGGTQTGGKCYY